MRFEFEGELETWAGDWSENEYLSIDGDPLVEKVLYKVVENYAGADTTRLGKWRVTFEKVEDDE